MADRAAPGCLQREEGEKEDILLLSRNTGTDRQTDRREGRKGQHRPGQGNPADSFPMENFLFQKENIQFGVLFCFFGPYSASLTRDTTGLLKTREPSPSGVTSQDKEGPDHRKSKSLNFAEGGVL